MSYLNSTFIISPYGQSEIVFQTFEASGAGGYFAPASKIDFKEEEREQVAYSSGVNLEGGDVVNVNKPLVDIEFQVIIWSAVSRTDCVARAGALMKAISNPAGGIVRFNPNQEMGRDTYLHYLRSEPLETLSGSFNTWDAICDTSGRWAIETKLLLKTRPISTSDPENLAAITPVDRTVVDNTYAGAMRNFFTISSADIEGDRLAALRLRLRNLQSNTKIGRVYLMVRSAMRSILSNFKMIYEAEDATLLNPTTPWSVVSDAARSNGQYRRLNPPAAGNNIEHAFSFVISNEADHRGRVLVFAVLRTNTAMHDQWEMKIRYLAGNQVVARSVGRNTPETWLVWHAAFCGAVEMPGILISDTQTISPTIEVVFTRISGELNDSIDVDFIALLFEDEGLIQFDIADGYANSQVLHTELLPDGKAVANVGDFSTNEVEGGVDRHYGASGLLIPSADTAIYFLFERNRGPHIEDDFSQYEGSYWLSIIEFEDSENLNGISDPDLGIMFTLNTVQGEKCLASTGPIGSTSVWQDYDPPLDLENDNRFTEDDFICIVHRQDGTPYTPPSDKYLYIYFSNDSPLVLPYEPAVYRKPPVYSPPDPTLYARGYHEFAIFKKSSQTGWLIDWSSVGYINVSFDGTGVSSWTWTFDYLRVEKADPDNAAVPNATGTAWDFQPNSGQWTITKDSPSGPSVPVLACLDYESFTEKTALVVNSDIADARGFCQISLHLHDPPDAARIGIVVRCSEQTSGAEDMYAFTLNFSLDMLEILRYTSGGSWGLGSVSAGMTFAVDTWYWLGFSIVGSDIELYFSATEPEGLTNSAKLADLLTLPNRFLNVSDSTHATGKIGIVSIGALARVGLMYVEAAGGHVPADQIGVDVAALHRTIVPFT